MKKSTYQIKGLDCVDCSLDLERAIRQHNDVNACELHFNSGKLIVEGSIDKESIRKEVARHGYVLEDSSNNDAPQRAQFFSFLWHNPKAKLALIGALFILPGLLMDEILYREVPYLYLASILAMLIAGFPVYRNAFYSLRNWRKFNVTIDHLMTIASIGAVIIGAYTEAGMVMVLFGIGEALEGYTGERSRDAIRSLLSSQPKLANLQFTDNGQTQYRSVDVETLAVDNVIMVKPGEIIPIDGQVIGGSTHVNQAAITGESKPVKKEPGSSVFAGSINGQSALTLRVDKAYQDSTIAQMARLVEEAQASQAPFERFINRFAARYTPIMILVSLLVVAIPTLVFKQPLLNDGEQTGWLYRGLSILVIGCPCALVISTPVSLMSAMMRAFKEGIVIRGGRYLEALANIKAAVFDKTGTLTRGEPSVVQVRSLGCTCTRSQAGMLKQSEKTWCEECRRVIALASAVEQQSEHPLARAIVDESVRAGVSLAYQPAEEVRAEVGQGVTGKVSGHWVFIGSHRGYHQRNEQKDAHCDEIRQDALHGLNPLLIAKDDQYLGTITVTDTIRESAGNMVQELHQLGIGHVAVFSGDDKSIVEQVGYTVHADEVRGELFPADKLTQVRALQKAYGSVMMTGDGINDAPALAAADVGIAIAPRGKGTAQAMETADITILDDNLEKIPMLVKLARRAMRMVHTNLWIALGMKLFFLILVIIGLGTMWMAVIADVGATLIVTLNGMRLGRSPGDTAQTA